jgi:hypothetical protein
MHAVWFCEMEVWRTVRTPEGSEGPEQETTPPTKVPYYVKFQELLHGHGYSVCCKVNQCELCIVKWYGHRSIEDMQVA